VAAALAASSGGCGYSLAGRGSFLPATIRVIGVPEFANQTTYVEVERRFTERVRSELIGRGRNQVMAQESGADAVLRGTITGLSIVPANFNDNQQATRYIIIINTKIEFVDLKAGKTLWENPSMVFRE
jgi:hypothetical protein